MIKGRNGILHKIQFAKGLTPEEKIIFKFALMKQTVLDTETKERAMIDLILKHQKINSNKNPNRDWMIQELREITGKNYPLAQENTTTLQNTLKNASHQPINALPLQQARNNGRA